MLQGLSSPSEYLGRDAYFVFLGGVWHGRIVSLNVDMSAIGPWNINRIQLDSNSEYNPYAIVKFEDEALQDLYFSKQEALYALHNKLGEQLVSVDKEITKLQRIRTELLKTLTSTEDIGYNIEGANHESKV